MDRIERFTVPGPTGEVLQLFATKIPWTELNHGRILFAGLIMREVTACYEIADRVHRRAEAITYAGPDGFVVRAVPYAKGALPPTVWERILPPDIALGELLAAYWVDATAGQGRENRQEPR